MDKQVKWNLDQLYTEVTGLNIVKPLYKKHDFSEQPLELPPSIIDKFGEELVFHESKNLMN
jgi:hypothetical protein